MLEKMLSLIIWSSSQAMSSSQIFLDQERNKVIEIEGKEAPIPPKIDMLPQCAAVSCWPWGTDRPVCSLSTAKTEGRAFTAPQKSLVRNLTLASEVDGHKVYLLELKTLKTSVPMGGNY